MKRQQWWRSRCPSKDCRYDRESSSDGASKREAEEGPGTQERRDAGVERRPVAEGESPPFGCGVDARVTRRTLADAVGGAIGAGAMPARPVAKAAPAAAANTKER